MLRAKVYDSLHDSNQGGGSKSDRGDVGGRGDEVVVLQQPKLHEIVYVRIRARTGQRTSPYCRQCPFPDGRLSRASGTCVSSMYAAR